METGIGIGIHEHYLFLGLEVGCTCSRYLFSNDKCCCFLHFVMFLPTPGHLLVAFIQVELCCAAFMYEFEYAKTISIDASSF